MPNGFRGNATFRYLTDVDNALQAAGAAHSLNPLAGLPNNALQPLPVLPTPVNVPNTRPPGTAHSGSSSVGFGSSQNIVTDQSNYSSIMQAIDSIDQNMEGHIGAITNFTESLCHTVYRVPRTTPNITRLLSVILGTMATFRATTTDMVTRINTFASETNSIS